MVNNNLSSTNQELLKKSKRKTLLKSLKRGIPFYLMLLLPMIWYVIFCYIPMSGLIIAFKDYNLADGFFKSPWHPEGIFYNFKYFLTYPYFWKVFKNTVILGTVNTLICFPAPILLALFFNELKQGPFKKMVQTISYLPYFVSTIALLAIVMVMFANDGLVNYIIRKYGGDGKVFLSDPKSILPIYVLLNLWRSLGWGTIIYTSAMSNISPEIYEAADIDGAGRLTKIFKITLPMILPTIIIMFILAAPGLITADFETLFLLGNEATSSTADVISTWLYRLSFNAIGLPDYSLSTAVGLFQSVLNLIVVLTVNTIANKVSKVGLF